MTAVAIMREESRPGARPRYRAVARSGTPQSVGRTAGEALGDSGAVERRRTRNHCRGTRYAARPLLSKPHIARLRELIERVQTSPESMSNSEQSELTNLIDLEFRASAQRTATVAYSLGR